MSLSQFVSPQAAKRQLLMLSGLTTHQTVGGSPPVGCSQLILFPAKQVEPASTTRHPTMRYTVVKQHKLLQFKFLVEKTR
jgi:hypothetical protein